MEMVIAVNNIFLSIMSSCPAPAQSTPYRFQSENRIHGRGKARTRNQRLVGGAVLTAAIVFGLGGQHAVRRGMRNQDGGRAARLKQEDEASLWRHL